MAEFIAASEQSASKSDMPYWYNESSNKGFLAAAVWKLGGVAIQEYTVDKASLQEAKKRYPGRCDLWFYLPTLGMEYSIEAKFDWVNSIDGAVGRRNALTVAAADQIRDYDPAKRRACEHMSAVFLSPYSQSSGDADKLLKEIFGVFSNPIGERNLCAAYRTPFGKIDDVWRDGIRYFYPGVVLFLEFQEGRSGLIR